MSFLSLVCRLFFAAAVDPLGADDFAARERASARLASAGVWSLLAAWAASTSPDPEVGRRGLTALAAARYPLGRALLRAEAVALLDSGVDAGLPDGVWQEIRDWAFTRLDLYHELHLLTVERGFAQRWDPSEWEWEDAEACGDAIEQWVYLMRKRARGLSD